MAERLGCVLCDADLRTTSHVAAPLGGGKRVCGSCVNILQDRYAKLVERPVNPASQERYRWKATLNSGEIVDQYLPGGGKRSYGNLDYNKVKRLRFLSPLSVIPDIDLHVRLQDGERGIAFFQKTGAGSALLDIRQVVGIQKPVGGHSVKFFVLCCADGRIIVSSTDNVE